MSHWRGGGFEHSVLRKTPAFWLSRCLDHVDFPVAGIRKNRHEAAYLSSHTSLRRLPLKMLMTMNVSPLKYGCQQTPPRPAGTDGSWTLRRREPDSNNRSRSCERSLSCCRRGRRTDKLDEVIKHRSSRETTMVGRGASLRPSLSRRDRWFEPGSLLLRLTTNSNRVGCWTGRSGRVPAKAGHFAAIAEFPKEIDSRARWRKAPAVRRHERWATPPEKHCCLFDDLVGTGEDRGRDRQAECLGGHAGLGCGLDPAHPMGAGLLMSGSSLPAGKGGRSPAHANST